MGVDDPSRDTHFPAFPWVSRRQHQRTRCVGSPIHPLLGIGRGAYLRPEIDKIWRMIYAHDDGSTSARGRCGRAVAAEIKKSRAGECKGRRSRTSPIVVSSDLCPSQAVEIYRRTCGCSRADLPSQLNRISAFKIWLKSGRPPTSVRTNNFSDNPRSPRNIFAEMR
jgi:hypothetical protein